MGTPGLAVEERLARLMAEHFDADVSIPPIVDVTGAHPASIAAVRTLPVITIEQVDSVQPPRERDHADLAVPADSVSALTSAVQRNPASSVMLTQLIRATSTLAIEDALVMESIAYSALQAGDEYRAWLSQRTPSDATEQTGARIRVEDGVDGVTIWLDRPEQGNALDTRARHELVEVLTALENTGERIILRGAGRHFCTGGDLTEFSTPLDVTRTHHIRLRQGLPSTVARLGARIETHVHGAVIGAGVELSAFAGRIVAHPQARFRLPEIRMGLLPGSGGTVSVPRRIGVNRALLMMLTGRVLDAHTALAWGLVDELAE
ncbi:MAG: enoyl-CoA hydratase/isomerase family protein [Rhodoglobus sp.]